MNIFKYIMLLVIAITLYTYDTSVNISWDAVEGAVAYTVQVIRDSGEIVVYTSTLDTVYTITKLGAGQYTVYVVGVDSDNNFGYWCTSTDPSCAQLKTGDVGAWKLKYNPIPPGPVRNR